MGAGLIFAGMAEGLGNAGVGIGRQMYADAAQSEHIKEQADAAVDMDNRKRDALTKYRADMAAKVEKLYSDKINSAMAEGPQQIDPKSAAMDKMAIARSIGAEDVAEGYRKDFDTMARRDTAEATAEYYRSAREGQAEARKVRTDALAADVARKNKWTDAQIDALKNPKPDGKADERAFNQHNKELERGFRVPNESGTGTMPDAQAISAAELVRDRMTSAGMNARQAISFTQEFTRSVGQEKLRTLGIDQVYALADAYAAKGAVGRPAAPKPTVEPPKAEHTPPPKANAPRPSAAADLPQHERGLLASLRRNVPAFIKGVDDLRRNNLEGRIVPPSPQR